MSKQEKLLKRLQSSPKDFRWDELVTLLTALGWTAYSGKGSSRKFVHPATGVVLMMHEPHPGSILKSYQVRAVLDLLRQEGTIR